MPSYPRHSRAVQRIVIVGGSLAGFRSADALRSHGFAGSIDLVGSENHLPYDRPPLSKAYLHPEFDEADIWLAGLPELDALNMTLWLGQRAVNVDIESRHVDLENGIRLSYDALIVATGGRPRLVAGLTDHSRPESVLTLRTLEDARDLAERLQRRNGGRPPQLVIVGGGFIGSEVASTGVEIGAEVVVVDSQRTPMGAVLHDQVGEILAELQHEAGVDLRMGKLVKEIMVDTTRSGTELTEVRLESGEVLRAESILVAVGINPNTSWLVDSGLRLDDGLLCDQYLRAHDGVYAVGDVTRWGNPGEPTRRLEHWTNAIAQADHVAQAVLAGEDATPFQNTSYYWSDQFGVRIEVVGDPPEGCDLQFLWGSARQRSFVAAYRMGSEVLGLVSVAANRQMLECRKVMRPDVNWAAALSDINW